MKATVLAIALFAFAGGAVATPPPQPSVEEIRTLEWTDIIGSVSVSGVSYSDLAKSLAGKRVRLRGYASEKRTPELLFISRFPSAHLHPDDEAGLPWDSAAVKWRGGKGPSAVPKRPTIEGVLDLKSATLEGETVLFVLEDAVPYVPPS